MQFVDAAIARQDAILLAFLDIPDDDFAISTASSQMLVIFEADNACDSVLMALEHQRLILVLQVP